MSEARKHLAESETQADAEGVMVFVSRQALHEFLGEFDELKADLLAALKVLKNRVGADLNQGVHGDDNKEKGYKIVYAEYKKAVKAIENAGG